MSTLRFLGAVDAAGATQQCLDELIAAQGDERKRVFRRMLTDAYPAVVGLVPQNASLKALEDAIATLGLSGDTMRKGVAFFIRAAEWAELPVSPHWKAATKRGPRRVAGATTRRARPAKRANGGAGQSDRGESGNNGSTTSDVAALRTRYIEMLMKKADEEGADAGLLDRIEALLGFEPRSTSA